jgi:hypothetical protein
LISHTQTRFFCSLIEQAARAQKDRHGNGEGVGKQASTETWLEIGGERKRRKSFLCCRLKSTGERIVIVDGVVKKNGNTQHSLIIQQQQQQQHLPSEGKENRRK